MSGASERFAAELKALIPRLRRFGHALTGSRDAGDDLLQDALEKALRRKDQFKDGTRLDSWMFRIMQTTFIDQIRSGARRRRHEAAYGVQRDFEVIDGERGALLKLELDETRSAMAELSDDERAVLALVSLDGLTYREAAEILRIPIGTVMSRLSRARSILAQRLGQQQNEPGEDR